MIYIDTFYAMFHEDGFFVVKRFIQELEPERKRFVRESKVIATTLTYEGAKAAFRLFSVFPNERVTKTESPGPVT